MRQTQTENVVYQAYNSVKEMAELPVTCKTNNKKFSEILTRSDRDYTWYGFPARDGADALAQIRRARGGKEALARARAEFGDCNIQTVRGVHRVRQWADGGDHLDIHRVYNGQLNTAWQRTRRVIGGNAVGSHATVVVNIATPGRVRAKYAFWRGAVAGILVDTLQKSGRSVQLVAAAATRDLAYSRDENAAAKKTFVYSVVLKRFDHVMAMDMVMATAGAVGFFRTFGFLALTRAPYKVNPTLGVPTDLPDPEELAIDGANEGDVIAVPRKIFSREEATRFLDSTVERFNR